MCIDIVIGRFLLFSIFENSLSLSGENTWEGIILLLGYSSFSKHKKKWRVFQYGAEIAARI